MEGKRTFQEEERALQKMKSWERVRLLWNDHVDTGQSEFGKEEEKRENKQEGQLLSIKRVLNASQSSSFVNAEQLKILERGTELMKVGVLGRKTGRTIKPHDGWRL